MERLGLGYEVQRQINPQILRRPDPHRSGFLPNF
jgi:crotonobetainyl-CoA:carnitine CoA-transferase CaiB-like acyl-CoA transferase